MQVALENAQAERVQKEPATSFTVAPLTPTIGAEIGSILRAIEVPPVGGDTLFADMYAAYDELPDNVKAELEGKRARHTMGFYDGVLRKRGTSQAEMDALYAKYPPTDHPLVRTHPETWRKALYLHPSFIQEVIGMAPEESKRLLKFLFRRSTTPEYQCRFRWQKNSIAFWDNRCSQHYAVSDYWPAVRRMERVTIAGDRPY